MDPLNPVEARRDQDCPAAEASSARRGSSRGGKIRLHRFLNISGFALCSCSCCRCRLVDY
uniref:Uncharacterized protein n=1 Tax=Arundo donax TaxID=35708 RepID=A0A0A9DIJ1_ARUDO